ncbi:MAG: HAD family hydrolase [Bacteroidia bacterium]|nr:HAD family hydrolase [Bacteroidia bacterium]
MIIKADSGTFFVFDLDDTLYSEIDFLKSAYKSIAFEIEPKSHVLLFKDMFEVFKSGGNTFEYLMGRIPDRKITMENLLSLYRDHFPKIFLKAGVLEILIKIKNKKGKIGIITNGRSITQRNKLKALGLEQFIDETIISEEFGHEKPDESVYKYFLDKYPGEQFYFFGDNINNDFVSPKKLAWCCIGVLDKKNIHKKLLSGFSIGYLPHCFINKFTEIKII